MLYTRNRIVFNFKRKDILTPATPYVKLEDTVLSKISQSHRTKTVIPYI